MKKDNVNVKLVVTDDADSLKNYECADCYFTTDMFDEAAKHQEATRGSIKKGLGHEMWVRRGKQVDSEGGAISPL